MSLPYGFIRSISCPNCRNDIWETMTWDDRNVAECTNCGFERPFYRRKPRTDKMTPSQEKAIARIRRHFDGSAWRDEPLDLARFETELVADGSVWLNVETTEHLWTMDGGHFHISRRGKVTMYSVAGLHGKGREGQKQYAEHIARILKATLSPTTWQAGS